MREGTLRDAVLGQRDARHLVLQTRDLGQRIVGDDHVEKPGEERSVDPEHHQPEADHADRAVEELAVKPQPPLVDQRQGEGDDKRHPHRDEPLDDLAPDAGFAVGHEDREHAEDHDGADYHKAAHPRQPVVETDRKALCEPGNERPRGEEGQQVQRHRRPGRHSGRGQPGPQRRLGDRRLDPPEHQPQEDPGQDQLSERCLRAEGPGFQHRAAGGEDRLGRSAEGGGEGADDAKPHGEEADDHHRDGDAAQRSGPGQWVHCGASLS